MKYISLTIQCLTVPCRQSQLVWGSVDLKQLVFLYKSKQNYQEMEVGKKDFKHPKRCKRRILLCHTRVHHITNTLNLIKEEKKSEILRCIH